MIVSKHEQGTPEWHEERCGIPTSSNFDKIVTTKGVQSKTRDKYLYKVSGELITGKAEETYQNAVMLRGIEMEEEARNAYELISGNDVTQVGLCTENGSGASPDGFVGSDGLLEIKCPSIAVHVMYLIQNKAPVDYFQQMQGQMMVTGRKWVDFCSYYPGLKTLIVRVERDEAFISALEFELNLFTKELEIITKKIGG